MMTHATEEACRKLGNEAAESKKVVRKLRDEVVLCKERLSSTMSSAVVAWRRSEG